MKLRKKKKMSQLELAHKAGLDVSTINGLENGKREPMLKTMWRVANALGKSMAELVSF